MRSPASLSVLVPIYNERATIERLLNAVVAVKTGLTVEVLACDDGSKDGTREILSKLSLPGLKVIFTTGFTRNAVVHNGVLDHDVHFLAKPFTIEQLEAKLREVLDAKG